MKTKKQSTRNRPKHIPQRTCIGCRQIEGKRGLVRIVRTVDGVMIDQTGKLAGRGAYIHENRLCWEQVLKGNRLNQALRTSITPTEREAFLAFAETLPNDDLQMEDTDISN